MNPSKIGPFKIERELGRGGMGVVFLAEDTRLGRRVAIKALPDHLAADPDRLARFSREARTLAGLNHPNVAQIYGVEEQESRKYLVLEYVEGLTLAERLDRGPLPLDDALDICTGIAAGVEAAHENGVVHRDLKPANVKITPDGKVKVLDFGLARSQEEHGSSVASSGSPDSPTISVPTGALRHSPTIPGAIMGTAAYMSPEQARGRRVDRRSDVWSFGVILYECLTGISPFAGETATDSIGAVLHKNIDLSLLPPGTPGRIRDLIGRSLERDREKRLRDLGDAMLEIERARVEHVAGPVPAERRGPGWSLLIGASVIGVSGMALAAWALMRPHVAPAVADAAPPALRVTLSQVTDITGAELNPALSPDGSSIVYGAAAAEGADLFSLRIGGVNAVSLTADAPEADGTAAYSPDGESIVFRSERGGGGLFIMGATGESPRRLTDEGYDPDWSPDGASIAYAMEGVTDPLSRNTISHLRTIDIKSGKATTLLESDAVHPAWSPSGSRIAFWRNSEGGQRDVFTVASKGGEPVAVTDDAPLDWAPKWSPDGRFLYFISDRGGSRDIWRVPIDEASGKTQGPPQAVTCAPGTEISFLTAARRRHRLAFMAGRTVTRVMRLDLDPATGAAKGEPRPLFQSTSSGLYPSISPDGSFVVYTGDRGNHEDLYVVGVDGTGRRRLTNDRFKDRGPEWMRDGRSIVFYSNREGAYQVWSIRPDGSGLQRLSSEAEGATACFPAPVGRSIAFGTRTGATGILRLDRDPPVREEVPLPPGVSSLSPLCWSPEGDRLALETTQGASAASGLTIYTPATGQFQPVAGVTTENAVRFLADGEHLLVLDTRGASSIRISDGTRRAIWTPSRPIVASARVSVAPDGSWITFDLAQTEADLWIADIDDGK